MTQGESQVNVSTQLNTSISKLLSLKKFAEICMVSPRTIRFYDQKDLLKPIYVDKWTKYRYYSPEQARDFLRIRFMQNFSIPLRQIKTVIDSDSSDSYLEERLKKLNEEIEEKKTEYEGLEKLRKLFFENLSLDKVFKTENIGPFNLFCLKVEHGSYDSIDDYRLQIRKEAQRLGLKAEENDLTLYSETDYRPKNVSLEVAVICDKDYSQEIKAPDNYYFRVFPETKALVYDYHGPKSYFILVYQKLFDYLEKNNIKLKGSNFDISQGEPLGNKSSFSAKTRLVFPI